jgi:hypothetical protein
MYRGFNLDIKIENEGCYNIGLALYKKYKAEVKETLETFTSANGSLDGTQMQLKWFPQIRADVFISHSHKDEQMAITLAGWLSHHFGIKAFIDSCIWGYADDLLRIIDNQYCRQSNSGNYSYEKRNYSTSHVHMMLSTALSQMIDQTECLFFLNTPSSISVYKAVNKTVSPWIYSEIATTQLIRKKIPIRRKSKEFSKGGKIGSLDEGLNIEYKLDLNHLTDIDSNDLNIWRETYRLVEKKPKRSLDGFYDLNPPPRSPFL